MDDPKEQKLPDIPRGASKASELDDLILVYVLDLEGNEHTLELPTNMGLNLMEYLKASGFDIAGTCGGMALCATCHVQVLSHENQLNAPSDSEMDMLDTLPVLLKGSRLSCQIRPEQALNGLKIRLVC